MKLLSSFQGSNWIPLQQVVVIADKLSGYIKDLSSIAMAEFEIGGFRKLYGEVEIEAHRLLKNSITSDTYFLLSDALQKTIEGLHNDKWVQFGIVLNQLCELYGGFRNLCFSYFDFSKERIYSQTA